MEQKVREMIIAQIEKAEEKLDAARSLLGNSFIALMAINLLQ